MKTASFPANISFTLIDQHGNKTNMLDTVIYGCYEAKIYLSKHFGISVSASSIHRGIDNLKPDKFPYHESKKMFLAYANWALNFSKEKRCRYFDDEPNKDLYITDNPFVDVFICVKKRTLINN